MSRNISSPQKEYNRAAAERVDLGPSRSAWYLDYHLCVVLEGPEHDVVRLLDVFPLWPTTRSLGIRSRHFFSFSLSRLRRGIIR